jgi:lipoprotein-releasing system permease protein
LHKAFDDQGVDAITIKPKDHNSKKTIWGALKNIFTRLDNEQTTIAQLQQRLPHLTIQSWKDLYPALVSSLKLEKYVMFFILALITLVASMNMISLLFMQIQQKRRDIAILKVMGLSTNKISNIFLQLGLTITLLASSCGLGLAFFVGSLLERYPCIELPDVYYVSHLPARIDAEIFIVVFVVTMLIGFCATWFPARRAQNINVAQVLRHE